MTEAARRAWVIHCSVRMLLVDFIWCLAAVQAKEAFSVSSMSNEAQRLLMDVTQLPAFDEYSWMWGDAGNNLLGHGIAEVDLLRWSEWKNSAATMRDLQAYEGTAFFGRPVEMMGIKGAGTHVGPHPTFGDIGRDKMLFSSVGEAINYLRLRTKKDYSWMWGDAGSSLLGHRVAEMDPFRWSDWQSADRLVRDLRSNKNTENRNRPVEIREDGGQKMSFPSIDEAVNFLVKQANLGATPSPAAPPSTVAPTPPPRPIPRPTPPPARPIPRPTPAPRPAPTPVPASQASAPPAPAPSSVIFDHSEATVNLTAKTTARLLLLVGAAGILGFCGLLGCCILQAAGKGRKKRTHRKEIACGPGSSDDESSEDGSPRRSRLITDGELRRLLAEVEDEERLALTSSASSQADLPREAEAQAEVDRILATRNVEEIFGRGTVVEQKIQYRRLVRMLHPDKGLVDGERATLALRRVVEYHTVLMTSRG